MSRRLVIAAVAGSLGWLWWYPILRVLDRPQTPYVGLVLIVLVLVGMYLHSKVFWRYHKMVLVLRREQIAGRAGPEDTLYAVNQRIRYAWRVIESVWALGVGVLALLLWKWPQIAMNPNYGKVVVTYFLGSVAITTMLTWRDDRVLDVVEEADDENGAAYLTPLHTERHHHE